MVQAIQRATGRGPERCKSHWAGDDLLVVIMAATFSKAELTLIRGGDAEEMQSSRRALQSGIGAELREIIEETTGREVVAFMANSHVDPDVMIEVFVLAPENTDRHVSAVKG
jgi:uncharacterized protein YbcI